MKKHLTLMNKGSRAALVGVFVAASIALPALATAQVSQPVASTLSADAVGEFSATLRGTVTPNGSETTAFFEWGSSTFLTSTTFPRSVGSGFDPVEVTFDVAGLQENTRYFYRVVGQSAIGTSRGSMLSFRTSQSPREPIVGPFALTSDPASVDRTSAALSGTVNANGVDSVAFFEWGESSFLGNSTPSQPVAGTANTLIRFTLDGLRPGTTYAYRAVIQNNISTSRGSIVRFTTRPKRLVLERPPSIATGQPTRGVTSATLNGTVTPRGSDTVAYFEWGESSSLGNITDTREFLTGLPQQSITATITGLRPDTKYSYRAVAENEFGERRGATVSFRTKKEVEAPTPTAPFPVAPTAGGGAIPVVTLPASFISNSAVFLNARVDSLGNVSTDGWFEWGTTLALGNRTPRRFLGSAPGGADFSFFLSGLEPGTTYYFRAVAASERGVGIGSLLAFTTTGSRVAPAPSPAPRPVPAPTPTSMPKPAPSVDEAPPLKLDTSLDDREPKPGDEVAYTISYENTARDALSDATLGVSLPEGVRFIDSDIEPDVVRMKRNEITFELGEVSGGDEEGIAITVRVGDDVEGGTELEFKATLNYQDPQGRAQEAGDVVVATVGEDRLALALLFTSVGGAACWIVLVILILWGGIKLYRWLTRKAKVQKKSAFVDRIQVVE